MYVWRYVSTDSSVCQVAFLWEGNDDGEESQITYKELLDKV
jgi:hypothetical protein